MGKQRKISNNNFNGVRIQSINLLTVIVSAILVLSIVKPHFDFLPSWYSTFGGDILIIVLSIIFFTYRPILIFDHNFIVLVLYQLLGITLIVFAAYFSSLNFKLQNIFSNVDDIIRLLYYLLFFIVVYTSIELKLISRKLIEKIIKFTFILNVIIAISQLFYIPFLSSFTSIIFGNTKLRSFVGGYPRIYGSYFNGNWFGLYLVFILSWFTIKNNFSSFKSIFFYILEIFITGLLIFFTGSRTAVIGALVALLVTLVIKKRVALRLILIYALIITSLIFILNIGFFSSYIGKTLNRFSVAFMSLKESQLYEIPSLNTRITIWNEVIEKLRTYPASWIFGLGEYGYVDNSYIKLLAKYGILGIGALGFFFIPSVFKLIYKKSKYYSHMFLVFSTSLLVSMITAEFFFTTQVMTLWLLLLSLSLNERHMRDLHED